MIQHLRILFAVAVIRSIAAHHQQIRFAAVERRIYRLRNHPVRIRQIRNADVIRLCQRII